MINKPAPKKAISIGEACLRTPGERLTHLRKLSGYLLDEVADRTSISKSELSRLENDTRILKNDHRDALAKAYGLERYMLDDILDFDPTTGITKISTSADEDNLPRGIRELPCYDAETFPEKPQRPEVLKLAIDFPIRENSYGIKLQKGLHNLLPDNCLLIIDPDARVIIGDLVVDPARKGVNVSLLKRDDEGNLTGLQSETVYKITSNLTLKSFHKIIFIIPAPHLVCL